MVSRVGSTFIVSRIWNLSLAFSRSLATPVEVFRDWHALFVINTKSLNGSQMFVHSLSQLPFSFVHILGTTFQACDEIYHIASVTGGSDSDP